MDLDKFKKTNSLLQTRATKLNTFIAKLEGKVLVLPENFNPVPGSAQHFEFLELYARLLKAFEGVLEASRRATILEKEFSEEGSGDRETDELYRMLKSLSPDEIIALKQSYFAMMNKNVLESQGTSVQ